MPGKVLLPRFCGLGHLRRQVRSLAETIRLDSRTKLLNPRWYEGMLDSGYEGVRELAKRLNYTLGWSATSAQVDNFIYEDANATFIQDEEMRQRLLALNPHSFRRIVGTLLEVHGRGLLGHQRRERGAAATARMLRTAFLPRGLVFSLQNSLERFDRLLNSVTVLGGTAVLA